MKTTTPHAQNKNYSIGSSKYIRYNRSCIQEAINSHNTYICFENSQASQSQKVLNTYILPHHPYNNPIKSCHTCISFQNRRTKQQSNKHKQKLFTINQEACLSCHTYMYFQNYGTNQESQKHKTKIFSTRQHPIYHIIHTTT